MATLTTIAELKRALLDELQALSIASATAAGPSEVQVAYARPPVDQMRSEVIYFSDELRTVSDSEQRMTAGRRKRFNTWEVEIECVSTILSDAEDAEARCFAMVQAVEGFLADNPQPAEWANTPVTSGALYVVVTGYEVEHKENPEGFRSVEATILTEVKERLV